MFYRKFRFQDPEPGETGGGAVDRGDDFVSSDPDDDSEAVAAAAAKAASDKLEAELKAKTDLKKDEVKTEDEVKDDPKKDTRIPLSRHEAVLAKERERRADVERQLAQYQQGKQVADVNAEITKLEDSVLALEKDYAKLVTDGESDKAAAVMAQIRKAERDMAESKSDMKIQAAEARAIERARYGVALERIEQNFPTLNEDHADFDQELMGEVVELKDAYQLKGYTPTVALQKAVKALVETKTTRQELAVETKPKVDEKDVAAERKKDATEKAVKAVGKTPPSLDNVGENSDKLGGGKVDARAVMKMSQGEFAKLNDADLALMRGDTL